MLTVSIFMFIAFLLARFILGAVQRRREGQARGASFRRLVELGRIDATVGAAGAAGTAGSVASSTATATERDGGEHRIRRARRRRKVSDEHRRAILAARLQMREDFLDDADPGFYQYLIIFLVASVLGLVIETAYTAVMFGVLESRVGLVWGPFSPLYGVGAVLLTLALWRIRKEPVWKVFLISAVLGGALEQTAGWCMENFAHLQSWTYLGLPDHITQWIAWRFLIMWGVLGVIWCRVIMPEMIFRIGEPTTRGRAVLATVLTVFLALDIAMTVACFWRAGQRVEGVPPANAFEVYVDTHYDDRFMARTFENMKIGEDLPPADR